MNGWYKQWLGRDATQVERSNTVTAMKNGRRDEIEVAMLAGSEEFFSLAGSWVFRGQAFGGWRSRNCLLHKPSARAMLPF